MYALSLAREMCLSRHNEVDARESACEFNEQPWALVWVEASKKNDERSRAHARVLGLHRTDADDIGQRGCDGCRDFVGFQQAILQRWHPSHPDDEIRGKRTV